MSYLVFARKWRPQNFDEVVGQEHIATTLKNAISLNRVAHAYLFSGPRGIGKTSTARILAKALNCEKGPTPSPCNKCDLCREISEGRSLDVIEIDGASNRGIDQIRQLRESVKFAAAKSRFKIYIIDEVHQITTDGFNALLKTLEEPPPHVKFIFATTQAYKVLPTILSRCQRFDFRPLSTSSIIEKLKRIIKKEKLEVTEEALLYISRAASGSMRDAESILDQLGSFCKKGIDLDTVTSMLGTIDLEALWQISQNIIEHRTTDALVLTEKIINEGKDLTQFIAAIMDHFRNILITKTISEKNAANFIDLPGDYIKRISAQGASLSLEEIFYIFDVLIRAQENLRRALSSRVTVEMAVVKLTQRENLSSLDSILTKLTELEQSLGETETVIKEKKEEKENPAEDNTDTQAQKSAESLTQKETTPAAAFSGEQKYSWSNLLQAIGEEKMFVASYLEFGKMVGIEDGFLTIAFLEKHNFYKETLEHEDNKKVIEAKAKEIFQKDLKVKLILDKSTQAQDSVKNPQPKDASSKETSAEPIIQSALKIFQGRIIRRNSQ